MTARSATYRSLSRPVALLLITLLLAPMEAGELRRVQWVDLNGFVNRRVEVALPDGTRVSGTVAAVEADALLIDARRPGGPPGRVAVARPDLRTLRIQRQRKRGRVLGTTLGIVGGIAAGGAAAIHWTDPLNGGSGPTVTLVTLLGIASGMGALGYYAGRASDRGWEEVAVLP